MSDGVALDERLLINEIKRLPLDKKREVFDFVEFLRSREGGTGEITNLSEPVFARIWENEEDAVYDKL